MKLTLNKNEICEYQQNREPYLMIDYATEVIPGQSAEGFKNLKEDEWFFKVHWPNDPNMPGMLQLEALTQMCALSILTLPDNKGKIMYLASANNIKFFRKVTPGKKFLIKTKVNSFKRGIAICEGAGFISDEVIACKAEFNLVLPNLLTKIKF